MERDPLGEQLERARDLGFLGPGPVERHLAHAEALIGILDRLGFTPDDLVALDLGSGGGLPGLVLARRWETSRWVLLDANERRTAYLRHAVASLGLDERVGVRCERAERAGRDAGLRGRFGLVTARSFGPPAVTAECGAPFLAEGGLLAVSEPPEPDPARWPAEGLSEVGLEVVASGSWTVFRRQGALPERYPRREGIPARRPLW